jgi:glutamate/tyrosine decarboxylase-like PLP-dependent enzyme
MDAKQRLLHLIGALPPRLAAGAERLLRRIPAVDAAISREHAGLLAGMEDDLKPYRREYPPQTALPEHGRPPQAILAEMEALQARETPRWKEGYASGAVYHGDAAHIDFLNRVYAVNSQSNPLHADIWPSTVKYEAEIVAMTAAMLGRGPGREEVCGTVSSGGTESILLAMKTYRDQARQRRGIRRPEMVAPVTAHAAFDKAAQYFGIRMVRVPVDGNFRADVQAVARAITGRTVVVVGSAPSFPHGMVDPIPEMSALALRRGVGFHTDACLGGFVLPWAGELGYPVPVFDFRLPGVTSISVDTHKYGYAAKGTSVILYRTPELRRHQYYATADWPGGLYFSPTLAGSRPGALSAACWAALVAMGREGYRDAARRILETGAAIKAGIRGIPGLHVLGDPLWVIAFASRELDIYRVMERMTGKGWSLNGLHRPACVHLCVTLRHTRPGVAQRFLTDLRAAVDEVRAAPAAAAGMAPVYGLAATLPLRGVVRDMLKAYLDLLYKV